MLLRIPWSNLAPTNHQRTATGENGACGGDFVLHPEHGGGHISDPYGSHGALIENPHFMGK